MLGKFLMPAVVALVALASLAAPLPAQAAGPATLAEIGMIPDKRSGSRTASGEAYSPQERTAAHRTLPLGSLAWVTNLANGRSVLVRINDRPQSRKIEMEISRGAAQMIGMGPAGGVRVQITPVQVQTMPTMGGEEFAIAVGTYPELLRAAYRQMGLERSGLNNVRIQRLERQGASFYRVILGGYTSPEAASAAAADLEARRLIEVK